MVNAHLTKNIIEINFFFAVCGLPIVCAITYYSGELWYLLQENTYSFYACLLFSGLMGIVITCACLMVCTICSPVAFNITGNLEENITKTTYRKLERHSVDLHRIYIFQRYHPNFNGGCWATTQLYGRRLLRLRLLPERKKKEKCCRKGKQERMIVD